jgi:2-dehydro-3-deoxyphosphogluconate aldolase/(4S)-4-hydroxy-2-oxoglutarate aldolase
MRLLERGYDMLKFFPAEAAGGAPYLKSLAGPLPQVSFCPTGGVSTANALDYLSCPTSSAPAAPGWRPPQCRLRVTGTGSRRWRGTHPCSARR